MAVIPTFTNTRQIDAAVQVASKSGILDESLVMRLRAEKNSLDRRASQKIRKDAMLRTKEQNEEYLPLSQKPDQLAQLGSSIVADFVTQISLAITQKQLDLIEGQIGKTVGTTYIPHEDSLRNYLSFRSSQIGGKK